MAYYAIVFALITIAGGVMGYVKAGSQVSLIASGVSGALLLGFAIAHLKEKKIGYWGLIAVSAILLAFFGQRYLSTGAVMPALIMVVLSVINILGLLVQARKMNTSTEEG